MKIKDLNPNNDYTWMRKDQSRLIEQKIHKNNYQILAQCICTTKNDLLTIKNMTEKELLLFLFE